MNELVNKLRDWQRLVGDDCGDLGIRWQDDMPLVTVTQEGRGVEGFGTSLEEALKDYAQKIGYKL